MKTKLYCSLLLCVISLLLKSQTSGCPYPTPPPFYTPNWDWTLPANTPSSPNNWNARVSNGGSNGVLVMNSPFFSGGSADVNDIAFVEDYKPNQGWLLLYKDFGYIDPTNLNNIPTKNDLPVFMLYNKYRSLIRLYIFANNYNGQVNYSYVNTEWQNPNITTFNNSLLTMGNKFAKANSEYPNGNNTDKLSSYINDYPGLTGWTMVEIPVHFDPNTSDLIFGERVKISVKDGSNSTISLGGNIVLSTKSAAIKDPPAASPNSANPNLLDYVQQGKEYLGRVPSRSELESSFNAMATTATNLNTAFGNQFSQNVLKLNAQLQNGQFKKYLLSISDAAAGLSGAIGLTASILKVFVGKADPARAADNQKFIEPTISSGYLQLQGKITIQFNAKDFELQLPGTLHKNSSGCNIYLGLPYYDCPLGAIAVQETPTINKKVFYEPQQDMQINSTIQFAVGYKPPYNCPPTNNYNQTALGAMSVNGLAAQAYQRSNSFQVPYPIETINSFQVSGKLKLALNDAAGLDIIAAKAALYFVQQTPINLNATQAYSNGTINEYSILPDNDPSPPTCASGAYGTPYYYDENYPSTPTAYNIYPYSVNNTATVNRYYVNRLRQLLNRGILELSKPDANGFNEYQTPFIDIDKFDGTSITIQDGSKPYIKILVVLKPTDPNADQTPVNYVMTYEIPNSKFNVMVGGNTVNEYPMTCEQRINDGYKTVFTANAIIGPGIYQDHAIVLAGNTNANMLQTVNPNGGLAEFKAVNYIKVSDNFKTNLSNGGKVYMHIAPVNNCINGGNSYQLDHHFSNCNPDPLARLIGNGSSAKEIIKSKNSYLSNTVFDNIAYLYPNPNSGSFTLFFRNELANATLLITNDLGVTLKEVNVNSAISKLELNFPELKSGVYFISIISNEKNIKPIKFIVY